MKNDDSFSRKSFLKTAGSTALFAAIGIPMTSCGSTMDSDGDPGGPGPGPGPTAPPEGVTISGDTVTIDLSKEPVSHLANEGQWRLITQAGLLVVNVDGDTIRSFTNVCTHQGCTQNWSFTNSRFNCSCHGSQFNIAGEWLAGPEGNTGDLEEFDVSRSGNTVTITKP